MRPPMLGGAWARPGSAHIRPMAMRITSRKTPRHGLRPGVGTNAVSAGGDKRCHVERGRSRSVLQCGVCREAGRDVDQRAPGRVRSPRQVGDAVPLDVGAQFLARNTRRYLEGSAPLQRQDLPARQHLVDVLLMQAKLLRSLLPFGGGQVSHGLQSSVTLGSKQAGG